MSSKRRVYRVAEQIQILVANQLQKVADPRFHLVTVTSVVVSPDLRIAKVYWVVTGDAERIEEVSDAFDGARALFRKSVGRELGVRIAPELIFYYDDTLDTHDEIERLMLKVRERESSQR